MSNTIDANGIHTETLPEVVAKLENDFRTIYGDDVVLDQDTPDGELLNIISQIAIDNTETTVMLNSFIDPSQAIGRFLDRLVALNGIVRLAGTPTLISIEVKNLNDFIVPLDGSETTFPYTIRDDEGNEWVLLESYQLAPMEEVLLTFKSVIIGKVFAQPNTITNQVTIITGVNVNNPTVPFSYGVDEEKDQDLRLRRERSVSISAIGYLDALEAALENISGITSAIVHENNTSETDQFGQSPHSIWVIVSGVYDNEEVAQTIYSKRGGGEGMNGSKIFFVTRRNGSAYEIKWDDVVTQDVFIFMELIPINASVRPNIEGIKNGLATNINLGVYQPINVNMLSISVNSIDPNSVVVESGVSLSSGGVRSSILYPSSKKNKFLIKPENIIITPMILLPNNSIVEKLDERQFVVSGGKGPYLFELTQDNSGGEITPLGYYTAGNTAGVDIVKVTDSFGNETTTNITVS